MSCEPRLAVCAAVLVVHLAVGHGAFAQAPAELCARTAGNGGVQACIDAIAADDHDLASRRNLALAFLSRDDEVNCFRVYQDVIARAPDDAEAQFGYAAALATYGLYVEAAAPMRQALWLNPDDLTTLRLAHVIFQFVPSYDESYDALIRGAALGDSLMMFDLAMHLRRGRSGPPDPEGERYWLTRAAEHGHVTAMQMLSEIYRDGSDGAPRNPMLAARWAERAAREGYTE